jgi:hypothetical protein
MYCLHCGDCCKRLSPISSPEPYPYIIEKEKDGQIYVLCGTYDKRPKECINHQFPARVCPIGNSIIQSLNSDQLRHKE